MGADGHIVICKRADWDAQGFGVEPGDIGLYTGEFLGMECCWGYWGDNLFQPNYYDGSPSSDDFHLKHGYRDHEFYDRDESEQERVKTAAQWFERNAEEHEVWT